MSIWSSYWCPECKGGELGLADCMGWLRLSCPDCGKQWIIVLPESVTDEIARQLGRKMERTVFEKDYEKGIEFLIKRDEEI